MTGNHVKRARAPQALAWGEGAARFDRFKQIREESEGPSQDGLLQTVQAYLADRWQAIGLIKGMSCEAMKEMETPQVTRLPLPGPLQQVRYSISVRLDSFGPEVRKQLWGLLIAQARDGGIHLGYPDKNFPYSRCVLSITVNEADTAALGKLVDAINPVVIALLGVQTFAQLERMAGDKGWVR